MKRRQVNKIWKHIVQRRVFLKWKSSTFNTVCDLKARGPKYRPARITTTGPSKLYINGVFLCKVDNVRITEKRA